MLITITFEHEYLQKACKECGLSSGEFYLTNDHRIKTNVDRFQLRCLTRNGISYRLHDYEMRNMRI